MNDKKCALLFYCSEPPGGAERRLMSVFLEIGAHVLVYYSGSDQTQNEILLKKALWTSAPLEKLSFYSSRAGWYRAIKDGGYYYVALSDFSKEKLLVLHLLKRHRIRLLWIIADYRIAYGMYSGIKNEIYERAFVRNCTKVDCLYPSAIDGLKMRLRKHTPLSATPLPYVDLSRFRPIKKENEIVFSARLVKDKGLELCINAIVLCASSIRMNNYHVSICGDGEQKESAQEASVLYGCSDIIEFKGYCNMYDILPTASIFLSLQKEVNYPSQSLLEAIASGCYCITVNGPDIDSIIHSNYGAIVEYSVESVSNALVLAMERSEDEKLATVHHAREFAEKSMSKQFAIDYFNELVG